MHRRMHPIWTLVLFSGVILALNMGIRQTFGLYLKPISLDLDLDRQVFSFAMALLNLIWGLMAPVAGALSDRFGAVRVIITGALLYVIGLLLMATATSGSMIVISGVVLGLGISGTGFTAIFGVIARAAPDDKRASALSLVTMGSAIGQFVALPYVSLFLDRLGWTNSLFIMAGTAAIMAPLAFALSQVNQTSNSTTTAPEQTLGMAINEAIRYPSFLLLTAGFFVCGFHIAAVAIHFPSFLTDKGFDPALGATSLMIIGAGNIAGTYIWGRLGTVMSKRIALTVLYLARGVVFLAILYLPLTTVAVYIYAGLLGLVWLGTIPLTTGLLVTFFGPRWLSTLYGIVFLSHQIGSFTGAWVGGWFYDHYRSYDLLWWASIAVAVLAAVLHLPIRERSAPRIIALAAV